MFVAYLYRLARVSTLIQGFRTRKYLNSGQYAYLYKQNKKKQFLNLKSLASFTKNNNSLDSNAQALQVKLKKIKKHNVFNIVIHEIIHKFSLNLSRFQNFLKSPQKPN